jgi:hypothetical protein
MIIDNKLVNATPRNLLYKYFNAQGAGYVTKTTNTQNEMSTNDNTGIYVDNLSDFPTAGEENVLYIDITTKICYVWNEDTKNYAQVTANVQKIIAGTNVTVSPTSGVGEVTVNAENNGVTQITAGNGITISNQTGNVTISVDIDFIKSCLENV